MPANRIRKPADPPAERTARNLTDEQLLELLEDLRARAASAPADDTPALESAIAGLECEAAVRMIELETTVQEPTPPSLAWHLLMRALDTGDRALAHRALRSIGACNVFVAYQRIREHTDRDFRIFCLIRVLFRLDLGLLGFRHAVARQEKLECSELEPEDFEAYVQQCIAGMFGIAFSAPQMDGEG
jgi:hypothetical protein